MGKVRFKTKQQLHIRKDQMILNLTQLHVPVMDKFYFPKKVHECGKC